MESGEVNAEAFTFVGAIVQLLREDTPLETMLDQPQFLNDTIEQLVYIYQSIKDNKLSQIMEIPTVINHLKMIRKLWKDIYVKSDNNWHTFGITFADLGCQDKFFYRKARKYVEDGIYPRCSKEIMKLQSTIKTEKQRLYILSTILGNLDLVRTKIKKIRYFGKNI